MLLVPALPPRVLHCSTILALESFEIKQVRSQSVYAGTNSVADCIMPRLSRWKDWRDRHFGGAETASDTIKEDESSSDELEEDYDPIKEKNELEKFIAEKRETDRLGALQEKLRPFVDTVERLSKVVAPFAGAEPHGILGLVCAGTNVIVAVYSPS